MTLRAVWHQLVDFSRLIGLRDRLRCPKCKAVGTWKPHGGWLDLEDSEGNRRWLCKWCGYYRHPVLSEDQAEVQDGRWVVFAKTEIPAVICRTPSTPRELTRANPWKG